MRFRSRLFSAALLVLFARTLCAEDRTIDGTFNHLTNTTQGAAKQPMIRHGYVAEFSDPNGAMITEPARAKCATLATQSSRNRGAGKAYAA